MTREEMIDKLREYCESRPVTACFSCPIRKVPEGGVGCENFNDRTDKELAACIEKITPEIVEAEAAAQVCENVADEEAMPVKHMIVVSRDEMCAMKGRLLMLSCCSGVTITNAMADELLFMVETIDRALSESGEG